jgi:hypothetical protein
MMSADQVHAVPGALEFAGRIVKGEHVKLIEKAISASLIDVELSIGPSLSDDFV